MATLAGFHILEILHASSNSQVYRARRGSDGHSVVIKMLGDTHPSPETIAWFRREYEITRAAADIPGVIQAYELRNEQQRWFMVLEDFGGTSLAALLAGQPRCCADEVIEWAVMTVTTLAELHRQHIIHKDINPANLVYNPATRQLKVIDFGIASVLSRESASLRDPSQLQGTLAYISPEQTGRMNRAIDYRTDFYSLGVTLYELITQEPPFCGADPLELVHAHIARRPMAAHEHTPEVDRALSSVIAKLMAKNAEDRYQSAHGLLHDLDQVRRQRAAAGQVSSVFPLGQADLSDRLQLPQTLYGRARELRVLSQAFERVAGGSREILLISGYSGIGKSALIKELYRPVTRQRGYFIAGKFDQLQRDVPYASLIQAFRGLVRQLLSESRERIARWRDKLAAALGPNGRIITEVIPEVEVIIGPQPPLAGLEPSEAQNRFKVTFCSFISVLTQREHPLVLFIDDLQWVDGASLELLQTLMTSAETPYLFLVGAYRDNEVSDTHPLLLSMAQWRKAGLTIHELSLAPLDATHVGQLLADTLGRDDQAVRPLAQLIHEKTGGNPFFISEFLKYLHAEGLLTCQPRRGGWQWSLADIAACGVTDNIVELMAGAVKKLAPATRHALELAACMGNVFDLRSLAIVSDRPPPVVAADLWDAVVQGLIVPLDDAYKLTGTEMGGVLDAVQLEYRFAHDRIQQAAYSLIADADKRRVHWCVGKQLLANTSAEERGQRIFDIVHQLGYGLDLARGHHERDELARLYLAAGRRAKASAAYEPALRYLQCGIGLLVEPGALPAATAPAPPQVRAAWQRDSALSLALFDEAAEAACLCGEYGEMQALLAVIHTHAASLLDRIRSYKTEIQSYAARGRLQDGVQVGCQALALLGIDMPQSPGPDAIAQLAARTTAAWAGRDIEELAGLPEMTEETMLAAMELMARLYIPAFNAAPGVFAMVVSHQVLLSVTCGLTASSSRGLAAYGFLLCAGGDIDAGYRFGKLALAVSERFHGHDTASASFLFNTFVRHWRDCVRDAIEPLVHGYRLALDSGDLEFAALNLVGMVCQSFWSGVELPALAEQAASHSRTIGRLKQELPRETNDLYWQTILNLLSPSSDPCALIGPAADERIKLPFYERTSNVTELAVLHSNKLILCYLFGAYEQAAAHAQAAMTHAAGMTALMMLPVCHFYCALTWAARYGALDPDQQARARAAIDEDLAKLRTWATHAPTNFEHKVALISAERARVLGELASARELYDRAIALAQAHGFIQEEALAYELAAGFHRQHGHAHLARHYLREAHYGYERWGARAKVAELQARYPHELDASQLRSAHASYTTPRTTSRKLSSGTLDLASVLKASQALSREIVLDKLLATLLTTVLENAGAQRASLILETNGELVIEAEGEVDSEDIHLLQSIPVAASKSVLSAVVYLVARSGQPEVIHDASGEGMFAHDSHVQRTGAKSILCMPLMNRGKQTAILYLENNLVTGAFTHERIEVLDLLSAEMAIAIDNARLYREVEAANQELAAYSQMLEDRVAERTHELAHKNRELEAILAQLRETQELLILREKMASLGTLTAGIAHEIRNPLNLVNNFAGLSQNLADELVEELEAWLAAPDRPRLEYIKELLDDLAGNAARIEEHGKRANGIVSSMLLHTQISTEERVVTDLNHLLKQSVELSHHALRARHLGFEAKIVESYDASLPPVLVVPQDFSRVFINVIENACYATRQKWLQLGHAYVPQVWIHTACAGQAVEIRLRDNGMGIPAELHDKVFQPFFTTKPPGEGTGLGLSISYDIVVRKHRGELELASQPGEYTELVITLPRAHAAQAA